MVNIDVTNLKLVPTHLLLTEEEANEAMAELKITKEQLPKILIKDPCVKQIGGKVGDVVKVIRKSPISGEAVVYRLIIDL